jgi:hypothetical protein
LTRPSRFLVWVQSPHELSDLRDHCDLAVVCRPVRGAKQTRPASPLPIRPRVGTDRTALRAYHPRPERGHGHIPGQMIDVQDDPVAALVALDVERRTPLWRMFSSVMGSMGSLKRLVAITKSPAMWRGCVERNVRQTKRQPFSW